MAHAPETAGDDTGRMPGNDAPWRRLGVLLVGIVVGVGLGIIAFGCCSFRSPNGLSSAVRDTVTLARTTSVPPEMKADTTTLVEMRDVHFRIDKDLAIEIHHLSGEMVAKGRSYVYFDDPTSYVIRVRSAEVGLRPNNLRFLLNHYVFNYPDAPLTLHRIATQDSLIVQEGVLHKVVDIPFKMTAAPSVTPEGLIALRPVSMQVCSLPGMGLMDALGTQLEELISLKQAEGVSAEGNTLILDPRRVLPPPTIRGRLTELRVTSDALVQTFAPVRGASPIRSVPNPSNREAENYMFFHGGTLRFGDLMLIGSELQIVDADGSDPFDFYQDGYRPQLLAGYSHATPAGQITFMPDYAAVGPEVEPKENLLPVSRGEDSSGGGGGDEENP